MENVATAGHGRRSRTFQTAVDRWASVGPYYAMFPVDFAFEVVEEYTEPGNSVLDPFAGRGSSIYAAAAREREACGIEINPVGWLYSTVKLQPATKGYVLGRLKQIGKEALAVEPAKVKLPEFFSWAYSPGVLRFLLAAREELNWRASRVDATLMAFILIHLHGHRSSALSNQMRDSKAMAPDYAIRWWREREMQPPAVKPMDFLEQRIEWRYKKGQPQLSAAVHLGDSTSILTSRRRRSGFKKSFNLLFTSPPYFGVTNYHYDQWLRLWMLGGPTLPQRLSGRWEKRFESQVDYRELLYSVFSAAARKMSSDAVVYVRTDARPFTRGSTVEALTKVFPDKELREKQQPISTKSQTALFGDNSAKPGEVDLIMTPR